MRSHGNGFTLLELLITLAIIGLVFGAATAKFHGMFAATRLQASAQGLGDHFAYAISRAYTSGAYHTLVIDLAAGRYWIKIGRESETGQEILKRSLARGVKVTDVQVGYDLYTPPGVLSVEISPLGVTNDAIINLEDDTEGACAVSINALIQSIEYLGAYTKYEELQDAQNI
jgi:prepilin-type N-terminal cleavage/methylation domain-containing protein